MLAAPAVLAHEIKNPLSAIRGAGQLIARKLPPADKKLARNDHPTRSIASRV